jgi:hypothetical protein
LLFIKKAKMAIQATTPYTYNYGSYTHPYFRLVLHLPVGGGDTPVDCFMYPSKDDFQAGAGAISCIPYYIPNSEAPITNDGSTVVNKYLLYVTEKVLEDLQLSSPDTTFEIIEIPREGDPVEPETPTEPEVPVGE